MARNIPPRAKKKHSYRINGYIKGIGPVERFRSYYSPEQAIKRVADEYRAQFPDLVIFIEDVRVYEKRDGTWVLVKTSAPAPPAP